MTSVTLSTAPARADLLVIGIHSGDDGPTVAAAPGIPTDRVAELTAAAVAIGASGKADEVLRLPGDPFDLPPILTTGLGPADPAPSAETLRRAAGAALRSASARTVTVALPSDEDPDLVGAVADLERAIELNPEDATAYYNKACAYALMGEVEEACAGLEKAIELDGRYREMAQEDEDFAGIREEAYFQALVGGG